MHLGQQLHNLLGDRIQIGINLGQRARRDGGNAWVAMRQMIIVIILIAAPAPKAITAATSSPKLQNPNFADSKPGSRLRGNRAEANQGIQARRPSGFAPSTGFIETLRQGAVGLEIKTGFASQNSLCYLSAYFEKAINGIT